MRGLADGIVSVSTVEIRLSVGGWIVRVLVPAPAVVLIALTNRTTSS